MKKLFATFLGLLFFGALDTEAQALTDEQIIKNNIPSIFFTLKDFSTQQNLTKDVVLFKYLKDTFNSRDGSRYLIVVYSSGMGTEPHSLADLRVINIQKNGSTSITPKIDYRLSSYPLDVGCEIALQDLDGDGINEVLVKETNWKDDTNENYIFKWVGNSLIDTTPIIKDESIHFKSSGLLDMSISTFTIGGKHLIFARAPTIVNKEFGQDLHRIYQFSNNTLEEQGTFEYLTTVEKVGKLPIETAEGVTPATEGKYTLSVKNISDHNQGVRAEVSINSSVVIKSADFCSPPPPKENKIEKVVDGDANEDHQKGCRTKSEVSVDLTLMKVNTIKVKLFGKKGSRILVTIKKK